MTMKKIIAVLLVGSILAAPLLLAAPEPSDDASLGYFDRKRMAILKSIIAKNLPRDLSVKKIDTFLLGLRGAEITGFTMTENAAFLKDHPDMDPVFFRAERILVRISPWMLLLGQVYIREMTIEKPVFQVVRDEKNNWNFDDLSEQQDSKLIKWLRVEDLTLKDARYQVRDHAALNGPVSHTINDVDVTISDFTIGKVFNLEIKAATPEAKQQNFFMRGQAGPMEMDQNNEQIPLDADLKIVDLPVTAYNRYAFPAESPVLPESGDLDVDFHLTGDAWSGLTMTGRVGLDNLVFCSVDQPLTGAPIAVEIHLRQPVVLCLKRDRLAIPLVEMIVNGNAFHLAGEATNLKELAQARLEVSTGDVDIDVIQSIYPFFIASFPEELDLSGHFDMNVRLEGNQLRSRVSGQMDLSELTFAYGDFFFKPVQEKLVMTVDGLVNTSGLIKGQGDFVVEDCLLGHYNFVGDVLSRLLADAVDTPIKRRLLAEYSRLPHQFDAVEGIIRYADNRVAFDRIILTNLGPVGAPGIDGMLRGGGNTKDQVVDIQGRITMPPALSRRILAADPEAGRYLEKDTLVLGFQHTGRLENLSVEVFQESLRPEKSFGKNRPAQEEQSL